MVLQANLLTDNRQLIADNYYTIYTDYALQKINGTNVYGIQRMPTTF